MEALITCLVEICDIYFQIQILYNKVGDRMKTLLLDLDGTMYRGTQIMPGGKELIHVLQEKKHPYLFLTNNSKRTRRQNAAHMLQMGYENIQEGDFFTSAMAAAIYVRKHYKERRAFVIGEDGLKEALMEQGFELCEEQSDFVFVGLDQAADYDKYSKAVNELHHGAKLIGTNHDRMLAQPNGFALGNGSVVAMLEYASNQKSPCIGKAYAPILEEALALRNLSKQETLLVGDNLETDIQLGIVHGVETALVLGGVHNEKDIDRLGIHPDRIYRDLHELLVDICL